ncbi:hypothetical protein RSOL_208100 [Rhizoctonia solani AG-3 Rhs1AP]|uniref:Uncharacterized protein n=2 Tax=Rhizoctonia solani AG-3 TaxID=1086053 RepID=A0A074RW83_9AGAM|nr:hypothetical protein RSOL_208100 [Rhizoctonia solani AG-3 Rhs1AP]KEP51184.1 hypothetical protein V565_066350 [Rhizoctonia solani 123E]
MSSSVPQPIPGRHRSASLYSLSSLPALSHSPSISPHSPTLPQLSPSLTGKSLTQIFSGPQSPLKSFKSEGPGFASMKPGVVEEDEDEHAHDDFHGEFPASPPRSHTRHTSIGSAFASRPAVVNSSPPQIHQPTPAPRDSPVLRKPSPLRGNGNSLGLQVQDPVKQRGISPMGERMLKGHFDGFGM